MIFKVSANICFHESVSQKLKDLTQSDLTRDISCAIHIYVCVCVCVCVYIYTHTHTLHQQSPTFLAPGAGFREDSSSSMGQGRWRHCLRVIQAYYMYCALLLLLLTHQLHLRSSGIRSWRLETPALQSYTFKFYTG